MKLKKYFAVAAACAVTAISAALPVSAAFTDAAGATTPTLPQLQAPAPTSADSGVPAVTFNGQMATSAGGGAVLGNSTPADSASTGDTGVLFAVAGLFVTAGIGAAAVALKNRKK